VLKIKRFLYRRKVKKDEQAFYEWGLKKLPLRGLDMNIGEFTSLLRRKEWKINHKTLILQKDLT
jgi:hypothetical protein